MKKVLLLPTVCIASAIAAYATLGTEPTRSPAATVEAGVQAIRANDVESFLKLTLSDTDYAELRAGWDEERQSDPSPEEKAVFATTMEKFTAEGAEDELMAELEPKLAELRPQMAMMVGMFNGMAEAAIAQNEDMSDEEKAQGRAVLTAVATLLEENDITDPKLARRAVGVVCQTARKLRIESLDQVQEMSFEDLLSRADVVLAGVKELLGIYGVSIDRWLDTVECETVKVDGDQATVRVSFEVLGSSHSVETEMVKDAGRWIRKELDDGGPWIGGQRQE